MLCKLLHMRMPRALPPSATAIEPADTALASANWAGAPISSVHFLPVGRVCTNGLPLTWHSPAARSPNLHSHADVAGTTRQKQNAPTMPGVAADAFDGNERVYLFVKGRSHGGKAMKDLVRLATRAGGAMRMI